MIAKINLDKVGIGASLLCAIHCAVLPVLFTTLPLMGVELLENEHVEFGFILTSLVIGCFALYNGYKKHHHKALPLFVFVGGIALLLTANFLLVDKAETIVKMVGAIAIIIAHILNWYNCKHCKICK
ncbi:MAG: MerC domain-containing protein [Ferruginibacter sp.]